MLLLELDAIFHLNSRSTFVNEKYCIQNLFTIFIQMKSRQEKGKKLHSFEYELLNNYFFPQFFIIEWTNLYERVNGIRRIIIFLWWILYFLSKAEIVALCSTSLLRKIQMSVVGYSLHSIGTSLNKFRWFLCFFHKRWLISKKITEWRKTCDVSNFFQLPNWILWTILWTLLIYISHGIPTS